MNDADELTAVARLRNHIGYQLDLTDAEHRLADEIAADTGRSPVGPGGPRRRQRNPGGFTRPLPKRTRAPRRRVAIGAVASAAAMAAAGALIVALPHVRGPAAHRPSPGRQTPAAGSPGSSPPTRLGPARTEAELVAYSSAAAATAQLPGPHQWLYQKTVNATADARTGRMLRPPLKGMTAEAWWRADGQFVANRYDRRLHIQSMRGSTISDWPSIGLSYLRSLPSTPARLEAVITANIARDIRRYGRASALAGQTPRELVFSNIQGLLEDVPVLPPSLRAGLYGVLARLPDVHFDNSATDMAGRSGVAFRIAAHGLETEIIINRKTYAFMGVEMIAVKSFTQVATDGTYHFRKGGVYDALAVLQTGVVDHAGQRP
jgi:hypothetical protein